MAFVKGQVANPNGRPKGSRNKLSEDFIKALSDDFKDNGLKAIKEVRADRPDAYLKVIASLVPKEMHLKVDPLEELTDEQLIARIIEFNAKVRSVGEGANSGNDSTAAGQEPTGGVSPIH